MECEGVSTTVRVAVEVGRTFTDLVWIDQQGDIHTWKVPSTPGDPSSGVIAGLEEGLGRDGTGLPRMRYHDPRHSSASLLLAQGIDRAIIERLGHGQISTTSDLYTHVLPVLQRQAADRMEELLSSA